jgi:hypothetical protein
MSEIEDQLRADLAKAESDLNTLDDKRKRLAWQVEYLRRTLGNSDKHPNLHGEAIAKALQSTMPSYVDMPAAKVVEAVLRKHGKPMKVAKIVQLAVEGGYKQPNDRPERIVPNFSTILSRDMQKEIPTFQKFGRGLFGLKEWNVD